MATTIGASRLEVSIVENITINGKAKGDSTSLSILNIKEVMKRTVSVTTTEVPLILFPTNLTSLGSAGSLCGAFAAGNVRYIRITNKDNANFVYLVLKNEYSNECCIKLDYGQSFIYNGDAASGVIDTMLANQVALGFTEATGDTNNPTSNIANITATNKIIPGLRYTHDASGIPSGSSVGAITGGDATDGYRATLHTLVSRNATTGAESAVSTSGPADTDGTGTYSSGFGDLSEITAEADTASCDVEVYVATT